MGSTHEEFASATVGEGARTLPGRFFTCEAVYRAEQERLFGGGWVCAGRAEDAPEPGCFAAVEVAGERLLLVRDGAGALRALHNVCRHRGTRLCDEAAGRFGKSIQCPYHAWTYGLDGRLLTARLMDGTPGFDTADYPLHTAALSEWEGFVFVNLAREPRPFTEAFAPLLGRFAAWGASTLRRGARVDYAVQANWKLVIQNYSECYHCPPVHPELVRLSPADSGRNDLSEGPFLGGFMDLRECAETLTPTGAADRPPLPGIAGENLRRVYYYALFPNLLLSLHPDYVMAHFLRAEGPGRTHVRCEWYFHPEAMARPGFDPGDAVAFWDRVNRQDWRVCELSQLGVASRAYAPGPYAAAEGLLWAFDRHYLQALGEPAP